MFSGMFQKKGNSDEELAKSNISVRSPEELEQLEKMIQVGPVTFVFVHADWCRHCQTYKPIWNELLNIPGRSANMGMIHHDMVEKSQLLKGAKIPGYPTVLKVFPNGHIEKYKGQNSEMTNAVPNMRDAESMKKEILAMPVLNMTPENAVEAKAANVSADSVIKSIVLANRPRNNTITNVTKMNKTNVVNTLLRKNNKKSLKNNLLKSLDNILENNKKSLKDNTNPNNNNVSKLKIYAVSRKAERNIRNGSPSLSVRNTAVSPKPNEISIGATKIIPPMRGGSLFVALTQAVQQAGPAAALLLANAALPVPPKKSRGSTMRLTRKSKQSKSRKN
jgi:thiol-disulfide isomerase/thioredoxin